MSEQTLKAYHVYDKENRGEEGYHEIIFAATASKAKYASEAYANGVPWTCIAAKRDKGFDQYAGKEIPKEAFIDAGWFYECDKCGSFSATNLSGDEVFCDFCLEESESSE